MTECKECGSETTNKVFCSVKCSAICNGKKGSNSNSSKSKETYSKNVKSCLFCERELPYEERRKKFCSHSCSAKFNNSGVVRNGEKSQDCIVCQKTTTSSKRNCCSTKCHHKYHYDRYIARWLSGEESGIRGKDQLVVRIRKWLLENRGEKCEKCDWCEVNDKTGKVPITIHHIDGDYKNNRPENLEVLCPNCHSLTHNYGSLNKGNGRPGRQEWRARKDHKSPLTA
jgi:hypothetical protein